MSISLVSNTSAIGASGGATTSAISTAGASLIVLAISPYQPGLGGTTVSDNLGNTWTPLTARNSGANVAVQLFYCLNPTTSGSHTFTVAGASTWASIAVSAWSGVASYNKQNGAANGASGTTIQPGSVTPDANGALLITAAASSVAGAFSINSSFTISNQRQYSAAVNMGIALAHRIQTTAAALNPTWTHAAATDRAAAVAVFLPSEVDLPTVVTHAISNIQLS